VTQFGKGPYPKRMAGFNDYYSKAHKLGMTAYVNNEASIIQYMYVSIGALTMERGGVDFLRREGTKMRSPSLYLPHEIFKTSLAR
jgi:hypothetical protein